MSGAKILSMAEYKALTKKDSKQLKYRNSRCEWKGIKFDSKWERDYYQILAVRKKEGRIKDFQLHVNFPIEVEGQKICKMNIDFVIENNNGTISYEDTKSPATVTPMFKLKAKLFKAIYGHEIKVKLKGKW